MTDVPDAALREEVERLRAANAALERRVAWRRGARRASVVGLLTLGCGLAALSVVAIWLRVTLLDTDRYVSTVAPIAAHPAVQKAVADRLETAIDAKIDFDGLIRQALPERADVLAPVLAGGLRSAIRSRLHDFTASPRFQQLWIDANRRVHPRVVALLTGGRSGAIALRSDTIFLDLSPAVDRVKEGLRKRRLDLLANAIPPTVDGRIPLVQSKAITQAQGGIRLLKAVAIAAPILALVLLVGSVALSRPRRRGLLHAGLGVAFAMLLLIAALGVARSAYLDALGQGALPRQAASDIFDTTVAFLRHGVRIVVVAAVALAAVAFILELPLKRLGAAAWARFATDRRTSWIGRHRDRLMLGTAAAGALVLLVWSPLTGGVVLVVLIVVGAVVCVIAVIASQAAHAVAPAPSQDEEQHRDPDHGVAGGHP